MFRWWAVVVVGGAVALLLAWFGRMAGVPLSTVLTIGAGVAALMWTVVLVTLPWNLYFDARQILRVNAAGRERGIAVPAASDQEARTISRRTLRLALAGHLGTAIATAAFAWATGTVVGYYLAAFFLLTTVARPAKAFLVHLRTRLVILRREGAYPRDDVATVKATVATLVADVEVLRTAFDHERAAAADALRRATQSLADDLKQLRDRTATDLTRLETTQATDRADARTRDDRIRDRIDQMARRIEATLDGISDSQELLTGIRALVRLIRTDPT
jgi:hypothetical protein